MEAAAQLRLVRDETTPDGFHLRRIHDLPYSAAVSTPFFYSAGSWCTRSMPPVRWPDKRRQTLTATGAVLLLSVSGTDGPGQQLMARHAYTPDKIRWDHTFVDILHVDEQGVDHFDYTKFHDTTPWVPGNPEPRPALATQVPGASAPAQA